MLTISADLSELTLNQREALAGFILSFPGSEAEPSPERAFTQTAQTAAVVTFPGAPAVDKAGLPWDARIHSSSKELTKDGVWRKKRGVSDEEVAQVEAQLTRLMTLPNPSVSGEESVTAAVPDVIIPQTVPPPPVTNVPPPAPAPIETVSTPVPPVVVDGRQAFINLVGQVSTARQANKISEQELDQIIKSNGVEALPLLINRPDLIPAIAMTIEALTAGR